MNKFLKLGVLALVLLAVLVAAVSATVYDEPQPGTYECMYFPMQAAYFGQRSEELPRSTLEGNSPLHVLPYAGDMCGKTYGSVGIAAPPFPPPDDGSIKPFCSPMWDDDDPTQYDEDWVCCEFDEITGLWECYETEGEGPPPGTRLLFE